MSLIEISRSIWKIAVCKRSSDPEQAATTQNNLEQPGTGHNDPFYYRSSHADFLIEEVVHILLFCNSHLDFIKRTVTQISRGKL